MRDDGTEDTVAAPALAHGTTRGHDATIDARLVPAGQVTRASSPSLSQVAGTTVDQDELPIVDPANYQIIKELARGGMGRILEARDLRLGRPIAIKEVLHGDESARARFDREVRITARLQHPAIVHVTEAGQWPTGQPFFAMKLIRGKPLDVRIGAAKDLAERLALLPAVTAVVDALAYAHAQSVIHRDLKPANVLVGDYGETVVIDWGIAKDLTDQEDLVSLAPRETIEGETIEGSVIGTPSYMPPEQAAGERVDARADVYALGALLYQVLAGAPPFVGRTTAEVLAKVIEAPPPSLAKVVPDAPADLIAIVEKAMARAPAQRFPTANEMALELKRFQQGQLVASHRYSRWELIARWMRRYRAAVAVGAIAIVALGVFGVIGIWRIVSERHRADVEAMEARFQADGKLIADARVLLATDPTESLALLKKLSPHSPELRAARMVASEAAHLGTAHVMAGAGGIANLAFSADGRRLVSYELPSGTVRIWDLDTWTGRPLGGAPKLVGVGITGDQVHGVDEGGTIWRWPAAATTPQPPIRVRRIDGYFDRAEFSSDGNEILLEGVEALDGERRDVVRLVDLGAETRVLGNYQRARWAPDGKTIVAYSRYDSRVVRITRATGELEQFGPKLHYPLLATDGTRVWAAPYPQAHDRAEIRELVSNQRVPLETPAMILLPLPDGRVVASTSTPRHRSQEDTLRGSDKGTFQPFAPARLSTGQHALMVSDGWRGSTAKLRGHHTAIETLATSRQGWIASGDQDGTIRVWKPPAIARDHGDGRTTASQAALLAGGRQLLVTRRGPKLDLYDLLAGGRRSLEVTEVAPGIPWDVSLHVERNTRMGDRFIREVNEGPDHEVVSLSLSTDEQRLVTLDTGGHVVKWDLVGGKGKVLATKVVHAAIDLDGTRLATSRSEGDAQQGRILELWDLQTEKPTKLATMTATALAFGAGDRLAVGTLAPALWLWERGRVRELQHIDFQNYRSLAFSPDGTKLFAGTENWLIEVFDLVSGARTTWRGHMGTVVKLLVDPSGERVFSASADNTVRVWRVADGSSTVLRGHTGLVTSMHLADDDTLVTAAEDRTARIWDLQVRSSRTLSGHEDNVIFAGHVHGRQRVVAVDRYHQIAEYADNLPYDDHLFRAWLDMSTNLTK